MQNLLSRVVPGAGDAPAPTPESVIRMVGFPKPAYAVRVKLRTCQWILVVLSVLFTAVCIAVAVLWADINRTATGWAIVGATVFAAVAIVVLPPLPSTADVRGTERNRR